MAGVEGVKFKSLPFYDPRSGGEAGAGLTARQKCRRVVWELFSVPTRGFELPMPSAPVRVSPSPPEDRKPVRPARVVQKFPVEPGMLPFPPVTRSCAQLRYPEKLTSTTPTPLATPARSVNPPRADLMNQNQQSAPMIAGRHVSSVARTPRAAHAPTPRIETSRRRSRKVKKPKANTSLRPFPLPTSLAEGEEEQEFIAGQVFSRSTNVIPSSASAASDAYVVYQLIPQSIEVVPPPEGDLSSRECPPEALAPGLISAQSSTSTALDMNPSAVLSDDPLGWEIHTNPWKENLRDPSGDPRGVGTSEADGLAGGDADGPVVATLGGVTEVSVEAANTVIASMPESSIVPATTQVVASEHAVVASAQAAAVDSAGLVYETSGSLLDDEHGRIAAADPARTATAASERRSGSDLSSGGDDAMPSTVSPSGVGEVQSGSEEKEGTSGAPSPSSADVQWEEPTSCESSAQLPSLSGEASGTHTPTTAASQGQQHQPVPSDAGSSVQTAEGVADAGESTTRIGEVPRRPCSAGATRPDGITSRHSLSDSHPAPSSSRPPRPQSAPSWPPVSRSRRNAGDSGDESDRSNSVARTKSSLAVPSIGRPVEVVRRRRSQQHGGCDSLGGKVSGPPISSSGDGADKPEDACGASESPTSGEPESPDGATIDTTRTNPSTTGTAGFDTTTTGTASIDPSATTEQDRAPGGAVVAREAAEVEQTTGPLVPTPAAGLETLTAALPSPTRAGSPPAFASQPAIADERVGTKVGDSEAFRGGEACDSCRPASAPTDPQSGRVGHSEITKQVRPASAKSTRDAQGHDNLRVLRRRSLKGTSSAGRSSSAGKADPVPTTLPVSLLERHSTSPAPHPVPPAPRPPECHSNSPTQPATHTPCPDDDAAGSPLPPPSPSPNQAGPHAGSGMQPPPSHTPPSHPTDASQLGSAATSHGHELHQDDIRPGSLSCPHADAPPPQSDSSPPLAPAHSPSQVSRAEDSCGRASTANYVEVEDQVLPTPSTEEHVLSHSTEIQVSHTAVPVPIAAEERRKDLDGPTVDLNLTADFEAALDVARQESENEDAFSGTRDKERWRRYEAKSRSAGRRKSESDAIRKKVQPPLIVRARPKGKPLRIGDRRRSIATTQARGAATPPLITPATVSIAPQMPVALRRPSFGGLPATHPPFSSGRPPSLAADPQPSDPYTPTTDASVASGDYVAPMGTGTSVDAGSSVSNETNGATPIPAEEPLPPTVPLRHSLSVEIDDGWWEHQDAGVVEEAASKSRGGSISTGKSSLSSDAVGHGGTAGAAGAGGSDANGASTAAKEKDSEETVVKPLYRQLTMTTRASHSRHQYIKSRPAHSAPTRFVPQNHISGEDSSGAAADTVVSKTSSIHCEETSKSARETSVRKVTTQGRLSKSARVFRNRSARGESAADPRNAAPLQNCLHESSVTYPKLPLKRGRWLCSREALQGASINAAGFSRALETLPSTFGDHVASAEETPQGVPKQSVWKLQSDVLNAEAHVPMGDWGWPSHEPTPPCASSRYRGDSGLDAFSRAASAKTSPRTPRAGTSPRTPRIGGRDSGTPRLREAGASDVALFESLAPPKPLTSQGERRDSVTYGLGVNVAALRRPWKREVAVEPTSIECEPTVEPPEGFVFFFSYGWNMARDSLINHAGRSWPKPGSEDEALIHRWPALLVGFDVTFNKIGLDPASGAIATIDRVAGASVEGALWLIPLATLRALDCVHGEHYDRFRARVFASIDGDNDMCRDVADAFVYVAHHHWVVDGHQLPVNQAYWESMWDGAKTLLSPQYLTHLEKKQMLAATNAKSG
eukprot:Rmarinus@m.15744